MKKKLLFCIHNYYLLKNYILDLERLENFFEVTVIVSNHYIENQKVTIDEISKKTKVKGFYIIPYYSKGDNRSIYSILLTHLNLIKLKKKISFDKFDICISDTKFFIWTRIILEKFLSKNCKKIGVVTGSIALNLTIFKKILNGHEIDECISKVHKLREYKKSERKSEKKIFQKILNVKKRIYDLVIDRKILSYLFHSRNFDYNKYDFNLLETEKFDKKVVFHYSNFLFWKNWYGENKVYLCKHENKCSCNQEKKGKAIFLSSLMHDNKKELHRQIDATLDFFDNKIKNEMNISELHIKHHPSESKVKIINEIFENKTKDRFKIKFLNNNYSVSEIACNYDIAIGMLSSSLCTMKSECEKIIVYCLKSISVDAVEMENREEYFLKLFSENIIFYDDVKKNIDINVKKFDKYVFDYERVKFSDFLKNL